MNLERIDQICDRYEQRLKHGGKLSVEQFLKQENLPHDDRLLEELHRVEREFSAAGEQKKQLEANKGTVSYRLYEPTFRSDRYQTEKFHARGGMGEVWVARDGEIGRQVALKRLRKEHPEGRDRFLAEAQIAGQLEHPGIVPVHDLGVDSDANVYYVMKFVRGRTLADAIEQFHESKSNAGFPAEIERRRLLQQMIDLCEAIAYAHSQGVIHRDIKPDNVMLGPFGETLVLDWGLAKVLDQPELPGLPSVAVTSSGRSTDTRVGSVLGTPAYMAPELAEGHAAEVGKPCDVYLLGGTLYKILTGHAPRRGTSHEDMVNMARTVPPVAPRKLQKDVPKPLEAICMKAMSKREKDRYSSAKEVAEEIRRYLAGDPVEAYPEGIVAKSWRWAKRHRRQIGYATSAVLLLAAVGVAAAMYHRAQRAEAIEIARGQVQQFRHLSDELFFAATSQNTPGEDFLYFDQQQGASFAKQALAVADRWGPDLERLPLENERPELKDELYDVLLLQAQLQLEGDAADVDSSNAAELLTRASQLREPTGRLYQLVSRVPIDTDTRPTLNPDSKQATGAPGSVLDHFLLGEELRKEAAMESKPADPLARPGPQDLTAAIAEYQKGLSFTADHYWSHLQLARCLLGMGRTAEAIQTFGSCIAIAPQKPWAYSARGLAYGLGGDYDSALLDLDQVLQQQSDFQPARINRAWVYWKQERLDQAIEELDQVVHAEGDVLQAHYYLGQIYEQQQQLDKAVEHYTKCTTTAASFRPAYRQLAAIEYVRGNDAAADRHLAQYLSLASEAPPAGNSAQAIRDRGRFLRWVGTDAVPDLLKGDAQAGEVRKRVLLRAFTLLKKSVQIEPTPKAYYEIGLTLEHLKQYQPALDAYTKGLALEPANIRLLAKRGSLRFALGENDLAKQDYQAASQAQPKQPNEQILLPESLSWLGCLAADQQSVEQADRSAILSLLELRKVRANEENVFMVLHNLAAIFGRSAQDREGDQRKPYEAMALRLLQEALKEAKKVGQLSQQIKNIDGEPYFDEPLKTQALKLLSPA